MTDAPGRDLMARDGGVVMGEKQNGPPGTTVVIISAGFGGICMGIKLGRAGIPYTIFEKASSVGGVWRDNVYPGAACDIPSHLYSYSFCARRSRPTRRSSVVGADGNGWFNVRPEVQAQYNREVQDRLGATVWEAGCTSWYRTAGGKNTNNWPSYTIEYRRRTRFFDAGNYEPYPPVEPRPMTAASAK
jgi:cation diffusion facilitator CzcD-associated flavoprotein CzcO